MLTPPRLNNKNIKVLIVDDSPYNLFVLNEMLQEYDKITTID